MKKILVIDNTFDPPRGSPEIVACLNAAAESLGQLQITVARGPESGIPADLAAFDGVVISGSKTRIVENEPWIEKEMKAIRELYEKKIPTFGICYGEQLIAKTLGGTDFIGPSRPGFQEYGWVSLELKSDSPLLKGLPKNFFSFEFHQDEVKALPPGFRLTASSVACPIQAFDVEGAPMWGVQFHPERGAEAGAKSLQRKLEADPDFPVINHDRGDELHDPAVSTTIFRNFLRQVWGAS